MNEVKKKRRRKTFFFLYFSPVVSYLARTMNPTNKSASPRQTFALFCATGKDYRGHNLTAEVASALLDAVQSHRGNKVVARDTVDRMLNGEAVNVPASPSREDRFQAIWNEAWNAGTEAARKCDVVPMLVGTPTTPFGNDLDLAKPVEYVCEGVCGFAWVQVKPGTSSFAKWLVKTKRARSDSYYGGVCIWIGEYSQSMQRKEAHADAMAEVFRKHEINAYCMSRMD